MQYKEHMHIQVHVGVCDIVVTVEENIAYRNIITLHAYRTYASRNPTQMVCVKWNAFFFFLNNASIKKKKKNKKKTVDHITPSELLTRMHFQNGTTYEENCFSVLILNAYGTGEMIFLTSFLFFYLFIFLNYFFIYFSPFRKATFFQFAYMLALHGYL